MVPIKIAGRIVNQTEIVKPGRKRVRRVKREECKLNYPKAIVSHENPTFSDLKSDAAYIL